jgi:hypothetical protein
MRVAKPEFL